MCNNVAIRSADSGTEHIFLDINCRKKQSLVPKLNDADGSVHCAFYIVYWDMVYQEGGGKTAVTRENSTSMYMALSILGILSSRIFLQIKASDNSIQPTGFSPYKKSQYQSDMRTGKGWLH